MIEQAFEGSGGVEAFVCMLDGNLPHDLWAFQLV